MPSGSFQRWSKTRAAELDRLEVAHAAVGGSGRGRRWATHQVNQAYVVLLSSHFQGFCRDLHSESADRLVSAAAPAIIRSVLRAQFMVGRRLDRGNPDPVNIGSDYDRLGLSFWSDVKLDDARNGKRKVVLETLRAWRNAIAHQDFDPTKLVPSTLTLPTIRRWRSACNALAGSFDRVLSRHLERLTGTPPW